MPELPEDGGDSPETIKARQLRSQEFELKQKSEGHNSIEASTA